MTIAIDLNDVHYYYTRAQGKILKGVTLQVEHNLFNVIVGRIGDGKSTLLKLMNGIFRPSEGEVVINGKSVIANPSYPFHQEVGLLFENPADQIFYPIVADDVAFGPRNLKMTKDEVQKRVISACEEVEILHLLERETNTLSYGEKTLVALAGILAMKPKIIIMDSPEIGLDLWTKPKILNLIQKLRLYHTLIISTNDKDIIRLADRIHVLWDGKVKDTFLSYEKFESSILSKID